MLEISKTKKCNNFEKLKSRHLKGRQSMGNEFGKKGGLGMTNRLHWIGKGGDGGSTDAASTEF